MAKDVVLVPHNHFDPTWRRAFDRQAVRHGVTVQPYAVVEELCFNNFLRLAPRGYTFSDGQAAILRKYLERNPGRKEEMREMAKKGQLTVQMAGETVPDTGMPAAEGLVRNYLSAWPLYMDLVDADHKGLKMGWLEDAFGNSPNMPQILKGVGAEFACNLTYRPCPEDVWVGIDGTKIMCYDNAPVHKMGNILKHPPCPACSGTGCAKCNDTGLLLIEQFDIDRLRGMCEDAIAADAEWAVVWLVTEEGIPDDRVADLVDELNAKHSDAKIRFGTPEDLAELYRPTMEAALEARDSQPTEDLNPAMPGCLVSRIRNKQETRELTYRLINAEAKLATAAWEAGKPEAPPVELAEAWQKVLFNQFHDAITGTLIDTGSDELADMRARARHLLAQVDPEEKTPAEPPKFQPVQNQDGTVQMGDLEVTFDREGIVKILHNGDDVFGSLPYSPYTRDFRIGELVLEDDFGDAWGKRIEPLGGIQNNWSLVQLGQYNVVVETDGTALRWLGRYTGGDRKVKNLSWVVTARPSVDGKRIDFTTEVEWDTESKRLRVFIPVDSEENTATYEVPFGFIDRTFDQSKANYTQWEANALEFPTQHWVHKSVDADRGVTVLNKGLPCNRWAPKRFDLSLVRSPEWCFSIVETESYPFYDYSGWLDTGRHTFEYSIWPHYSKTSPAEITKVGYEYNNAVAQPPFEVAGDVVVTTWKCAQDGSGWILRAFDASGNGTNLALNFGSEREVTPTDLLERPTGDSVKTATFTTDLHKHGIGTFLIK